MSKKFVFQRPTDSSFSRDGLVGFKFPLGSKKLEFYYVDCTTGHGGNVVSDSITHIYYILEGSGQFKIDGKIYQASVGQVVEIPPKHSFDYNGQMKMLLIVEPPFSLKRIKEHNPKL